MPAILKLLLGAVIGAVIGFLYYKAVGCSSIIILNVKKQSDIPGILFIALLLSQAASKQVVAQIYENAQNID